MVHSNISYCLSVYKFIIYGMIAQLIRSSTLDIYIYINQFRCNMSDVHLKLF